jgi:hypothetical protein
MVAQLPPFGAVATQSAAPSVALQVPFVPPTRVIRFVTNNASGPTGRHARTCRAGLPDAPPVGRSDIPGDAASPQFRGFGPRFVLTRGSGCFADAPNEPAAGTRHARFSVAVKAPGGAPVNARTVGVRRGRKTRRLTVDDCRSLAAHLQRHRSDAPGDAAARYVIARDAAAIADLRGCSMESVRKRRCAAEKLVT